MITINCDRCLAVQTFDSIYTMSPAIGRGDFNFLKIGEATKCYCHDCYTSALAMVLSLQVESEAILEADFEAHQTKKGNVPTPLSLWSNPSDTTH